MTKKTCYVDGLGKDGVDSDECRAACLLEPSCTGFATSTEAYSSSLYRCFLHGAISLVEKYKDWKVFFDGKLTSRDTFADWHAFFGSKKNVPTKSSGGSHTACWRRKGNRFEVLLNK